jgi:rhodanese-related sulfurtransferase
MDVISPRPLYNLIKEKSEFALVDLREDGVFGARHLLCAVNIPFSHLEFLLGNLIPNRHVPIILCGTGDDDSLINRGALKFRDFGYKNISILEGGVNAWEREGFELFSGVNVPSKAFGEFVEKKCGTPHVSAEKLEKMIKSEEKLVILDSRQMSEYEVMNIPGGINVPGA